MQSQPPTVGGAPTPKIFVDAHVHIHDCFETQGFFDAAMRNFRRFAVKGRPGERSRFVLCLTETYGSNKFQALLKEGGELVPDKGAWRFVPSDEQECLIASHPDGGEIAVVAGRQIVTSERLEILGLGLLGVVEENLPMRDVVQLVADRGAIPVLPWGFGKWLGTRRQVVEKMIEEFGDGRLFLGDNSGRPAFMPLPAEFRRAREIGMKILPGTDPLPFRTEFDRAGSFGFYIDGIGDSECTWTELRSMLRRREGDLHQYGSLESPLRFVRNQVAMQYTTRVRNRWAAS